MDQLGYIKLHRQLFDSTLWSLPPDELRLAVYLLLRARHSKKPKKLPGVDVKRGEIITSLMDIAEACEWHENRRAHRWSKQKVARMLKALSEIEFLTHNSDTYGTHLSLRNYDTYQGSQPDNSDAHGTPPDTSGTPADASGPIQEGEERLNGKNEKKKKESPLAIPNPFKKWTEEQFTTGATAINGQIAQCLDRLTDDQLKAFVEYWLEPNQRGTPRYQLEKTWDTRRRIATWSKNNFGGNKSPKQPQLAIGQRLHQEGYKSPWETKSQQA